MKQGDRVRVKDLPMHDAVCIGSSGTITRMTNEGDLGFVRFDTPPPGPCGCIIIGKYFTQSELEPLPEEERR